MIRPCLVLGVVLSLASMASGQLPREKAPTIEDIPLLLESDNPRDLQRAYDAMIRRGDGLSLWSQEEMMPLLENVNRSIVRNAATPRSPSSEVCARTLASFGPDVIPFLRRHLRLYENDRLVSVYAQALGMFGPGAQAAIPDLVTTVGHTGDLASEAAINALCQMGQLGYTSLLDLLISEEISAFNIQPGRVYLTPQKREAIARAFRRARLAEKASRDLAARLGTAKDQPELVMILRAIGLFGAHVDKATRMITERYVDHSDDTVRSSARRSLATIRLDSMTETERRKLREDDPFRMLAKERLKKDQLFQWYLQYRKSRGMSDDPAAAEAEYEAFRKTR
jgi:hypothetical protein